MIFLQCEFHIPQGMYGFGLEEEEVGEKSLFTLLAFV